MDLVLGGFLWFASCWDWWCGFSDFSLWLSSLSGWRLCCLSVWVCFLFGVLVRADFVFFLGMGFASG